MYTQPGSDMVTWLDNKTKIGKVPRARSTEYPLSNSQMVSQIYS